MAHQSSPPSILGNVRNIDVSCLVDVSDVIQSGLIVSAFGQMYQFLVHLPERGANIGINSYGNMSEDIAFAEIVSE